MYERRSDWRNEPSRRHHERVSRKIIAQLRKLHADDWAEAAENYGALFRGERTDGALVAGIEFARAMRSLCEYVDAHRKKS